MTTPYVIYSSSDKALYSHAEAARYIGKHPNTLLKLVNLGLIKCHRDPHSGYRVYKVDDLNSYIKNLPEYNHSSESPVERRTLECKKMAG